MYLAINIIGIFVFLGVAFLFSNNKKNIHWRSVVTVLVINVILAWFFTKFAGGRDAVQAAANGFVWLVDASYKGIAFALPNWVPASLGPEIGGAMAGDSMNFITSALLPVLMIVPLFDILTYIGVLPFIIKWVGKGLSFITGQPKFESFFAVEMMFLGNTEALAVSQRQLKSMKAQRNVTIALMSMSCVTASILGAYIGMMPGVYVITAVPLNVLNAIIITSLLNPVDVPAEEDIIVSVGGAGDVDANDVEADGKKEPFFSFLGDSILGAGRLILIIVANVIAFVALAYMIDKLLALVNPNLSLENILGVIMFPFAWLLGFNPEDAFKLARFMGTKLVTNEFVVMGEVSKDVANAVKSNFVGTGLYTKHFVAVLTVFLTSFANFSTTGMIIGAFKGIVGKESNDAISKSVILMLISGILVSLMSAGLVGMFSW